MIPYSEAKAGLHELKARPAPAPRPIVVLGAFRDPGLSTAWMRHFLSGCLDSPKIVTVSYPLAMGFDQCVGRVMKTVDRELGASDPKQTPSVDVIGISLGGLVARAAAFPRLGRRHLNIARLFTIGTPHQGAVLAPLAPLDPLARAMCPGSAFLKALPAVSELPFPVVAYGREHDWIVGTRRTAPEGTAAIVVPARFPQPSHSGAAADARILLDLVLRLHGETPVLWPGSAPS